MGCLDEPRAIHRWSSIPVGNHEPLNCILAEDSKEGNWEEDGHSWAKQACKVDNIDNVCAFVVYLKHRARVKLLESNQRFHSRSLSIIWTARLALVECLSNPFDTEV